MAGEKTEAATPKRRQDERKKGNVFQSRDVVTVFSLAIVFYGVKLLWPWMYECIGESLQFFLESAITFRDLEGSDVRYLGLQSTVVYLKAALPILAVGALVAVVFTMAQTKMLVNFEVMKPKFNRLNPLEGFKKMFALRGVVELIKSLAKIAVLGYIVYLHFRDNILLAPRLMDMELPQVLAFAGDFILDIVLTTVSIFIFLAMLDYLYQWYEYEKNLRMSKEEIKEEYKQTEGDPQIKGKIKQKQREMSQRRMMQQVPSADVVIRNPTHYAVALKFEIEHNHAPIVVAKGQDYLALRIVRLAEANQVMTVENPPLARSLYSMVELNREIPEKFYGPVAEILALVYKLQNKKVL